MRLSGAMERGKYAEAIMKMRNEDLLTGDPSSMRLLGMHTWVGQRMAAMVEANALR
jgi:hypothetical protein